MNVIRKYFPDISPQQCQQYEALGSLYKNWNQKINIVSRKDIENLYEHHILHSLSIAKYIQLWPNAKILDIGTGGGFPGIPLAIYFPEAKFHLIDSTLKKIKVVNEISKTTGLGNLTTQHIRAGQTRGEYDIVVCRAVSRLKTIVQWSEKLVKKDKSDNKFPGIIALKGGDLKEELGEIDQKYICTPVSNYFSEDYFRDKYIVRVFL